MFLVGKTSNRRSLKIWGIKGEPPQSLPWWEILIPHNKHLRSVLGLLTVMILKRVTERVFSFEKKIYIMQGKRWKQRGQNL